MERNLKTKNRKYRIEVAIPKRMLCQRARTHTHTHTVVCSQTDENGSMCMCVGACVVFPKCGQQTMERRRRARETEMEKNTKQKPNRFCFAIGCHLFQQNAGLFCLLSFVFRTTQSYFRAVHFAYRHNCLSFRMRNERIIAWKCEA